MKKLTKIKLVNWHYFQNETIIVKGNTLITGENGAGKSTILDAIQYVLSPGKQKFNIAANDGTKRTVTAYVRGKLGKSDKRYLREGDVTAHIALEFLDDHTMETFIIGAVLDSRDPMGAPNQMFYDLPNYEIDDALYFNEDRIPFNISEFKRRLKQSEMLSATTMTQARKQIAMRFDITDYNYFDLLPKALAFKPINNVKDFIYSYILEEKNIDIEYLVGNIKTYKEFIQILSDINDKLAMLDQLDERYKKLQRTEEQLKIYLYEHMQTTLQSTIELIETNEARMNNWQEQLGDLNQHAIERKQQLETLTAKRDDIHVSLLMDDDYKLLTRLSKDAENERRKLNEFVELNEKIDTLLAQEFDRAEQIQTIKPSLIVENFLTYKEDELNLFNIENFIHALSDYYTYLLTERNSLSEERTYEVVRKEIISEEMSELYEDIKVLNEKKVLIPRDVVGFRDHLKRALEEKGSLEVSPVILSEALEVLDPEWQNAIEGYLGRARFHILVNPEYFKDALQIYKEIRKQYRNFPVSLVNTNELLAFSDENPNGLSSQVKSDYSYAKYYINYRLNSVIMSDSVEDLPNHKIAVTKDCILYSGFAVSELNPRNYERLYIGANASEKQLETAYQVLDEKKAQLKTHLDRVSAIDKELEYMDLYRLSYIRDRIGVKSDIFSQESSLQDILKTIHTLENNEFVDKKQMITELDTKQKELQKEYDELNERMIVLRHKISTLESKEELQTRADEERKALEEYTVEIGYLLKQAEAEYAKLIEQDINFDYLKQQIEVQINQLEKTRVLEDHSLVSLMKTYNTRFKFEGGELSSDMDLYYKEKERLRTSHLVTYQEKVFESKTRSEKELKEHFVYRLKESILDAINHFRDLNTSLSNIRFGTDEYQFIVQPNGRFKEYYDMLLDAEAVTAEGFGESFVKKHGKTLDKLMEHMISDETNDAFLKEIVDYRTYMDYDIEIVHSKTSSSLLSEISREKSGGETQIPYYVAMASTFIKIYQSHQANSDSMGIVLFDEAFDKIDSTRTEAMMKFLSQLGLQVILSTPPQKVEDIYPFVESTLVVTREAERSWVFTLNKENE